MAILALLRTCEKKKSSVKTSRQRVIHQKQRARRWKKQNCPFSCLVGLVGLPYRSSTNNKTKCCVSLLPVVVGCCQPHQGGGKFPFFQDPPNHRRRQQQQHPHNPIPTRTTRQQHQVLLPLFNPIVNPCLLMDTNGVVNVKFASMPFKNAVAPARMLVPPCPRVTFVPRRNGIFDNSAISCSAWPSLSLVCRVP